MIKRILFTISVGLTSIIGLAQNGAHIQYKLISDVGATGNISVYFMDGNSRTEMSMVVPQLPGGAINMTTITQKDKPNTHYQLNDKNKTYKEIVSNPSDKAKEENQECVVTLLGHEKIGAYNCTHVNVKQGKTNHEMWMTKEIPDYKNYAEIKGGKYMGNEKLRKALADKDAEGFAAKIIYKQEGGHEGTMTMELVKFEKTAVPADKFQIPVDYTKSESSGAAPGVVPNAQDMMNMTPEERAKMIEQMKKQYGK
jgi:hypothetical protein